MTEQNIPIDIHANKLLDWLISRRHCSRDWSQHIAEVREKIKEAIQDMPAHDEITKILSGTQINYYHCLQIVEILKNTESQAKNFFGQYSSKRMKDWHEIVKLYEKNDIYLAEVSQTLIRNLNYEIPALKQRIKQLQQMQESCRNDAAKCVKGGNDLKEKYYKTCSSLGIKGKNVKEELTALVKEMPDVWENMTQLCIELKETMQFYDAFAEYSQGRKMVGAERLLRTLWHLIEKGNTTVYEFRCGKKPDVIEERKVGFSEKKKKVADEDKTQSNTIDFGDNVTIDYGDQIDFGDNSNKNTSDWGSSNTEGINYNISVDDDVVVIESVESLEPSVAKGDDAMTILVNAKTRNFIVFELMELEAFLDQRLIDMKGEIDALLANHFQAAPPIVQQQNLESVSEMLSKVKNIFKELSSSKLDKNLLMASSTSYIEKLVTNLKGQLAAAEQKINDKQKHLQKERELGKEKLSLEPQVGKLTEKTRELQKMIEKDISKKYNNRRINIMGAI